MPTLSFRLFLAFASVAILVHSPCFANDNTQAPVTTNSRRLESPAPVELQPPSHQAKTFVPSSQVNYDETVIIKAPPPESFVFTDSSDSLIRENRLAPIAPPGPI